MERVNATGEIFISHTKLDGRFVLRLAVGNARTTEDDVQRRLGGAAALRAVIFDLWDTLVAVGRRGVARALRADGRALGRRPRRVDARVAGHAYRARRTGPLAENVLAVLARSASDPAHTDALSEMRARAHARGARPRATARSRRSRS